MPSGWRELVSVMVNTFGTGVIPEEKITKLIRAHFRFGPRRAASSITQAAGRSTAAIRLLRSFRPCTEEGFTWEITDKMEALREEAAVAHAAAR